MGYNGTYSYLITINIVTEHITHTWMFITFFGRGDDGGIMAL